MHLSISGLRYEIIYDLSVLSYILTLFISPLEKEGHQSWIVRFSSLVHAVIL